MKTKDRILELLHQNRGAYISGQELADTLQVSRTAIWKAITSLREEGYEICGSTKNGYLLAEKTDLLNSEVIASGLSEEARAFYQITCVDVTESTNNDLRVQGLAGAIEGTTLIAAKQTAGKGRKGRAFYSPDISGLYLSIILRPDMAMEDAVLITTATAVAAARACEETNTALSAYDIGIKWVNDLFLSGKKFCGILTEAFLSMETGGLDYAVMGIGFNLTSPKDGWPEGISDVATSLFQTGEDYVGARNELSIHFLEEFYHIYKTLPKVDYLEEYRRRQLALGHLVHVMEPDGTSRDAKALDVDDRCHLLVQYLDTGEEVSLNSGEISVKL